MSSSATRGDTGADALLELAAGADPQRRRALLERVAVESLPVAASLARRYRDRGEPLEDLVQVASLALVRAVHRYEPGRGRGFLPYAVPSITGELRRHLRDRSWGVRPPRRLQELRTAIGSAAADLTQAHGRSPTTAELALALGAPAADVAEALSASQDHSLRSLDAAMESPGGPLALADRLGAVDHRFDDVLDVESVRGLLTSMSVRDRRILELRFYRGWTQRHIADDVGVTQVQVSRLITRMLASIRAELEDDDAA